MRRAGNCVYAWSGKQQEESKSGEADGDRPGFLPAARILPTLQVDSVTLKPDRLHSPEGPSPYPSP